jgi:hypothetical protein
LRPDHHHHRRHRHLSNRRDQAIQFESSIAASQTTLDASEKVFCANSFRSAAVEFVHDDATTTHKQQPIDRTMRGVRVCVCELNAQTNHSFGAMRCVVCIA